MTQVAGLLAALKSLQSRQVPGREEQVWQALLSEVSPYPGRHLEQRSELVGLAI